MGRAKDAIYINDLVLLLSMPSDPGADNTQQSVHLSVSISHDTTQAAQTDQLASTIDYAAVSSSLRNLLPGKHYPSLEEVADSSLDIILDLHAEIREVSITATQPKGPLQPANIIYKVTRTRNRDGAALAEFMLKDLRCMALIGVTPFERMQKQPLFLDVSVQRFGERKQGVYFPFSDLFASIFLHSESSSFSTLEALASSIARHVLEFTNEANDEVTVSVAKPMAIPLAKSASVTITRGRADFALAPPPLSNNVSVSADHSLLQSLLHSVAGASGELQPGQTLHTVAIALGSNLGDRFMNIETALRLLEVPRALLDGLDERAEVSVVNTSFMYETMPMYVTTQPQFINCACTVETNLEAVVLLDLLKKIEEVVGREPTFRNGPRAVDLDILTFDSEIIDTRPEDKRHDLENLAGELVVPHPRLAEREFVLRPLNDIIPDFVHPEHKRTIRMLLNDVLSDRRSKEPPMIKVLPFPRHPFPNTPTDYGITPVPPTLGHWVVASTGSDGEPLPHKTYIMSTLNATPDSFSDGSAHNTLPAALDFVVDSVASGAHIIDVGGYSTRPKAEFVSTDEEISRVVPIIRAIRAHPSEEICNVLVSVDTFRWDVAQAAVEAGANCINDVHAFTGPDYPLVQASAEHLLKMREVARRLCVPVIVMHSRGDAGSNQRYDDYGGDLVRAVQAELGEKVEAIVGGRGGVRRWSVVVDPGFGFSKPASGQYAMVRNVASITADKCGNRLAGYPLLVGTSRKSFLCSVLARQDPDGAYRGRETSPRERVWATAATVAWGVQQGVNVVRVHDVLAMRDVVAVTSEIQNGPDPRS